MLWFLMSLLLEEEIRANEFKAYNKILGIF